MNTNTTIQQLLVPNEPVSQPPLISFEGGNEIAVVVATLALGGAERVVLDWAARIHPRWRVHLVVLRDQSKGAEWPVPEFVRLTRLGGVNVIDRLREIGREIAESGIPTCLCHLLRKEERVALSSSGAFAVPVLHNAAQGWVEMSSELAEDRRVIAVSQAAADELVGSGWEGDVSVIRHVPRPRKFAPNAREEFRRAWGIPAGATLIGMVGAVKPQKNYGFALEVLRAVRAQRDCYLVIVGGPIGRHGKQTARELYAKVCEMGLRDRVALPGFVPDAARCLPAFDLVLNTSNYEGFSIATAEALLAGKPVIASRVGGQGEMPHPALTLVGPDASAETWATSVVGSLDAPVPQDPFWGREATFRLWTLASLARPFEPSRSTLFVTANLNAGGAQRSLVNLSQALSPRDSFEVAVCGNSTSGRFAGDLARSGVSVYRTAETRDPFDHAEAIVRRVCEAGIGSVCFWNVDPKVKLLVGWALGFTRARLVDVSPGDNSFSELGGVASFHLSVGLDSGALYRRLDALVLKYGGKPPEGCERKTKVIPNGVPVPEASKRSYSLSGPPRVAVNGRIVPTKFILEIVAAMRHVWQTIPEAELHVFGAAEPRWRDYAEQVLAAAGEDAGKRILFRGPNFEAAAPFVDYDAYVVAGKDQGCPNALLEAMVAGLPVVASGDGGTAEQVMDGQTGLLVPECAPEPLGDAIVKILADRALAERLGRAGQRHVTSAFSMRRMADNYRELLEGLAA